MTTNETIQAQKAKIEEYEALFEEILEGKIKKEGVVLTKEAEGFYKVDVDGSVYICTAPKFKLNPNDHVVTLDGAIVQKLPEGLMTGEPEPEFERIAWSDVGGMQSQIENIRNKVELPVKHKDIYKKFNIPPSKGLLLYGPPGCGKTLIAKAIASSMLKSKKITGQMFVYLKGGELLDKYVGMTEKRIQNIFSDARKAYRKTNRRPIIFIDEAEAILPPRGSRISSDVETTIVPSFLSEMDGFEGYNPFVILATNYIEMIDAAVQRPGRIDLKVYVGRPTEEDAEEIFMIHLKKTLLAESIGSLSRQSAKYLFSADKLKGEISGALIENIVNDAVERAMLRAISGSKTIGVVLEDIVKSINNK